MPSKPLLEDIATHTADENVPYVEAKALAFIVQDAIPTAKDGALVLKAEALTLGAKAADDMAIDVPFNNWIGYKHDEWY